ncbi:hypothetical protein IMS62_23145 [Janthinobacterium sp. GW458P]|uniref:hypothetical protein n=1 Tax=Janthinobacterium sp. GW458P TaxID=1981504 RepID=UPI00111FE740|nr:hypothetical protein [Janthinobacterium sp. GW458P]
MAIEICLRGLPHERHHQSHLHLDLDEDPPMPLQRFRFGCRTGRDGLIAELHAMRAAGVRHIGLQLRQNRRPLTETLQEIAAYVLPHFTQKERVHPSERLCSA